MRTKALTLLLVLLVALPSFARDFDYTYEGQTIAYTVLDEDAKTVKVRDRNMVYDNVSGDLILPAHPIDGTVEYTLTTIGMQSFSLCPFLTSVVIPNTVTEIEMMAFNGCQGLTQIYSYPVVPPTIGPDAFRPIRSTIPVYVPEASRDVYSNAEGWNYFSNFLAADGICLDFYPNEREIYEGQSMSILASLSRPDGVEVTLIAEEWTSSDESVATVEGTDYGADVTAVAEGKATITYTATVEGGRSYSATCEVTVLHDDYVPPTDENDFKYTYEGQTITYTIIDEAAKIVETKAGYMESHAGVCRYVPGNTVSGELILPPHPKNGDVEYTLTQLGSDAFGLNDELTSVTIPETVTSIGNAAFSGCGLISISVYAIVPPILGDDVFTSVTNTIPVNVPAGSVEAYRGAEGWDYFSNFQETEASIKRVDADCFIECSEYITLQGIRVATDKLAPGVYIRRTGNRIEKIVVK